jgi:hypothetical protein
VAQAVNGAALSTVRPKSRVFPDSATLHPEYIFSIDFVQLLSAAHTANRISLSLSVVEKAGHRFTGRSFLNFCYK